MTKQYGLIGYPLSHSFSKQYFTQKFEREGIDANYELFELTDIVQLPALIESQPCLRGLNVTIPYKQTVIPYLHRLAPTAEKVGAVNVIKIEEDGTWTGHNSDYEGFRVALIDFLAGNVPKQALILGNGGAAKAVAAVLKDLAILYKVISRTGEWRYEHVTPEFLQAHTLIVNTTPLGMYPVLENYPDIPYNALTEQHFAYDLICNPNETLFLQKAQAQGAKTANGLVMLYTQAEEAWRIWQEGVG